MFEKKKKQSSRREGVYPEEAAHNDGIDHAEAYVNRSPSTKIVKSAVSTIS